MELRIGKVLILPRVDRIKDPETKRVVREVLKVIQKANADNYSDLVGLEARVTELEP